MPLFIKLLGLMPLAYLVGSIPCGLILTRLFTARDLTAAGSKNIGATNVRRVAGSVLGGLTLFGDVLKGALPVGLAVVLTHGDTTGGRLYATVVALLAFTGHLYPVYLKLKNGGKGVATGAGCFLILCPTACLVSILVFVLVICLTDRVSAGSLAAAGTLPLSVWVASRSVILTAGAGIVALVIVIRHKDNINRLFTGTEPPLREKAPRP